MEKTLFNRDNYPLFVCEHGHWDIWRNEAGECAAIPNVKGRLAGNEPSHFGTMDHVRKVCGKAADYPDFMRAGSYNSDSGAAWHFFRGYAGTALALSNDESDESGGEPLDANYGIEDIAAVALESMIQDCATFYARNEELIHCEDAPLSSEFEGPLSWREAGIAGYFFWADRCGHGVGFWDGRYPEDVGAKLSEQCGHGTDFSNVDLYLGDDGKIYQ